MKIGDLVQHHEGWVGIITYICPELYEGRVEVEVLWSDGECGAHTTDFLELLSEAR